MATLTFLEKKKHEVVGIKKVFFLKGRVEKKNVVAEHFENSFLCFNNSY